MKIKLLLLFIIFRGLCNAQVGIGTPLPNNSSQLDVVAANRGVLIARVQLQSTTSMSPIINSGSLPSSLLVFNEATAGTAPLNVTPGYYYWYNNKWNRIVVSSEATVPSGTVIFNPVTNTFSYIDQSGNQQTINFENIVKNNETITTLVNAPDGKHTYTSENNTVTVIDVVGDVTNNASTILNNPAVITELTNIIKNNETLTSLVYDATLNTLTYTAENGTPTVVNLLNLVQGAETQTSLIYDASAQTLTYNPENGVPTVINLSNLVKGSETITTLVNAADGKHTYTSENNTVTVIDVVNDVTNNASTILNNPAVVTELTTIIKNNETLTSLVYDATANTLTYNAENGTPTVVNLLNLVQGAETQTSLVYDSTAQTLTYNPENGVPTVINLANLVRGSETVTTLTPVVTTGNTIANYSNEAGTSVSIQETLTSQNQDLTSGDIRYTNEAGTISTSKVISANVGNLITAGTDGGSFIDNAVIKANETITTITPVVTTGNTISNYSNEAGTSVAIQETLTSQNQELTSGDISYTNEAGTISTSKVISANVGNLITAGTDGGSFINNAVIKTNETITTIAPVVTTGNTIANYSNEAGTSVAIQETLTSQNQDLTSGDISYTNEAGTISTSKVISANVGNLITAGTDGGSFIDNAVIKANETITTITPVVTTGNTISNYSNEAGTSVAIQETLTSQNQDLTSGDVSYTNEAGTISTSKVISANVGNLITAGTDGGSFIDNAVIKANETITTITPVVTTGNTIANYSNEAGTSVAIQETLTTLSYDPTTSILSYSNENGTVTPLDLTGLKSLVTAGNNVTITGNGETGNPYIINSPVETALLTPSTAIAASATSIAVPSTNVQGAIGDLATELKQKWDIRGNAATVAGTNFLGTTDNVDLVFKRNNVQSGLLSTNNTSFGVGANLLSGGNSNVAIGTSSLNLNTSGNNNTVLGYNALARSVSGSFNVAIGTNSLANSTVNNNTAIGFSALTANTTGTRNAAIGVLSLSSNTTGSNNIAIGDFTLQTNSTGSNNIASGYLALNGNTTGTYNIATGIEAMVANQVGNLNVAVGYRALANNSTGNNNTGIGNNAGNNGSIGSNNTALGDSALYANFSGGNNAVMGANALYANANGSGNVAVGFESGRYFGASGTNGLTSANNSVYVGTQIRALNNSANNEVVIGYAALGRGNNTVQIGNDAMTSIGGQVAWSNPSDLRLKKEIQTSSFGLNFINKLRPVTYHLKTGTPDLQSGFIAQEVESAANSIDYQFSGIVKPASDKDFYSLRYSEFVVPLVKAVQEQQAVIEKQDKKIADLETRLQRLEQIVNKLK